MAYGSAAARAYYGAGDFHTALALRSARMFPRARFAPVPLPGGRSRGGLQYARGYYSAGGFGSFLSKVAKGVTRVASIGTKLAGTYATGGLLGVGQALASRAFGTPKQVLAGPSSAVLNTAATLAQKLTPFGSAAAALSSSRGGGLAVENARRKTKTKRARKRRSSGRRRRRSAYSRGDWGDAGGRDKHGHFLNARGGHHNFRSVVRNGRRTYGLAASINRDLNRAERRRKRRRSGGRVSFTTKDGRRVSFTRR